MVPTRFTHGRAHVGVKCTGWERRRRRLSAVEQRTTAGSTARSMVKMRILGVVAALQPDTQDGQSSKPENKHNDHDNPLVVI